MMVGQGALVHLPRVITEGMFESWFLSQAFEE